MHRYFCHHSLSTNLCPVLLCLQHQAEKNDEELEALRAQLSKSAGAMEEVSTLKADLEDLRLAADNERKAAERAASEARQEADVIKQLR